MFNFIKLLIQLIRSSIWILLISVFVLFGINNNHLVPIYLNPIPYQIEIKFFLLLIVIFLLGILFGFVIFSTNLVKNRISSFKKSRLKKKKEKEKEQSYKRLELEAKS